MRFHIAALLCAVSVGALANTFGPEKRVLITDRATVLSAVGVVRQIASDGSVIESCTGTLIESRLVLTAAHCVGLHKGRLDPKIRTQFFPAMINGRLPPAVKTGRAIDAWAGAWRREDDSRAGDWAILLLDVAPGEIPRLPVAVAPPPDGSALMLVGYPSDLGAGETPSLQSDCHIRLALPDGVFQHDCYAYAGTSGGPLLAPDATGHVWVIGVHNAHKSNGTAGLKLARYTADFANLATSVGNFSGALASARERLRTSTVATFGRNGRGV